MKYITRGLASGRIPQVMATFKLLEAMCSLGQSAASALFHNFNFQSEVARQRYVTDIAQMLMLLYIGIPKIRSLSTEEQDQESKAISLRY